MGFFNEAINILKILVIALGAGLSVWGVVNLLEGYGNDNPGAIAIDLLDNSAMVIHDPVGENFGMVIFQTRHITLFVIAEFNPFAIGVEHVLYPVLAIINPLGSVGTLV